MIPLASLTLSTTMALIMGVALTVTAVFIFFFHDRKHNDLEEWVDYGFSRETLKQTLLYYRFMAVSMGVFFVLFVANCMWLQADGHQIYADGRHGFIATTFFALDPVTRGALFDVMEHWELHLTPLKMNRGSFWFVFYCFLFRMFYALTLIRILMSFAWIRTKIRLVRRAEIEARREGRQ